MSDTQNETVPDVTQLSEAEVEQAIGERLRAASQLISNVTTFGYPVPALMTYLEPRQSAEPATIITSDVPEQETKITMDMVISSPALTLVAYVKQQEEQGVVVLPEQKDVLRDELGVLRGMLSNILGIVDRRLEWLGPKEEKKLIVHNLNG